jgi:outer membrane protein OmpA-like peptidoglycan-associated protein
MKLHQGSQIIALLAGLLLSASVLHAEPVNLASAANGAKIAAYSSNFTGDWDVTNLIGGSETWAGQLPAWCTESNAPFPHWAVIELPRKGWLTTLIFNSIIPDEESGWVGISAKDVRLEVSTTSATESFKTVASFQLERNKNNQFVHIAPVEAHWLKIVINSNWGHPEYSELGKLGAFDDGTRPTDIAEALKTKGFVDVYGIYFDFGSAKLRPESDPVLKQIAGYLQRNPDKKVSIEGHTDTIGDEKTNQLLSENRAKAVVEALKGFQVKPGVLTATGYGASKPIGDNKTINGRAQNRRVTVRVAK